MHKLDEQKEQYSVELDETLQQDKQLQNQVEAEDQQKYAPMPLRQPLQDCSRYMGSSTMHRWHGKTSRMLLHSSENQRSMHPFGSFSIVLKRKRILPQSTLKIHPNDKTITHHFFEFRTPSLSGLQAAQMTVPPCKEAILQAKSHEDHREGTSPRSSSKTRLWRLS